MSHKADLTRRALIQSTAALPAAVAAPTSGPPPDQPRALTPAAADSGSAFPFIEQLAGAVPYPLSFLNGRFHSLDAWRDEARTAVLTALGPQPAPVPPNPEIVDRRDMGGHGRTLTFVDSEGNVAQLFQRAPAV